MQKSARVTPRNIQFQDVVEIRQIPNNEEIACEAERRPSWDPNLKDHDVFKDEPKKQRKLVIGIAVCGAILFAVVIAAVVAAVVSTKSSKAADNSLSYNEHCDTGSNQCMSSKNLYCPNGFCSCQSPLSWNSAASTCTLLTYNQACSTSSQCDSSLQLICTNSLCKCSGNYTYNATSSICTLILNNTLTYADTCVNGSSQCKSAAGLTCVGNCSCMPTKVWNVSACSCPSATFLNSSGLCETQRKLNESCVVGATQCDSARGLSCNNSICVCDTTKYWDFNFAQCYTRRYYSEACTYDSDCQPTLSCPSVPGVCNCANTEYYNNITAQCVSRGIFGATCTTSLNYTCLISLYCNAGTCACPSGKTWVAANMTCS